MNYLLFDTSSDLMIVSVVKDGELASLRIRQGKKDHSAYLIDEIDKSLKEAKINLNDIDQIIVGVGPGSYTGLRVSVMTAKMLALQTKIELRKISSLLFLTNGYKKAYAYHDAKNNQGFCGYFEEGINVIEEKLRNLDDLEDKYKDDFVLIDETSINVDVNVIIKFSSKVDDVNSLIPNYLRITQAESNANDK